MRRTATRSFVDSGQLSRRIAIVFAAKQYAAFRQRFEGYARAFRDEQNGLSQLEKVIEQYEAYLVRDPKPRFDLDAWIIDDITRDWSQGTIKFPKTIIPSYDKQWGHCWFTPVYDNVEGNTSDVFGITFPGRDDLSDANLLDYAWLGHELGHTLFDITAGKYDDLFSNLLDEYCNKQRRRSVADSVFAKERVEERLKKLLLVWRPQKRQKDWAHEAGVDQIALWYFGPAFLAAYQDVIENPVLDAFQKDSEHPPYIIRTKILLLSAQKLGWKEHCSQIENILKKWQLESEERPDHNELVHLGNAEIIDGAIELIFKCCDNWNIPRCTLTVLKEITKKIESRAPSETALDLILSAWHVHSIDGQNYNNWEKAILSKTTTDIAA